MISGPIREYFLHLPSTDKERCCTVRYSNPFVEDSSLLLPVLLLATFALNESQSCFFRFDISYKFSSSYKWFGTRPKYQPELHCGISKVEMPGGLWPPWAYGTHGPHAVFFLRIQIRRLFFVGFILIYFFQKKLR